MAFSVAVCGVLTVATLAAKVPFVEPAATVTEDPTVTAELLLVKLTA